MQFLSGSLLAIAAFASAVLAQENPIIKPDGSAPIVAGSPTTVTWVPTTAGTITLTLRQGESTYLKDVAVITSSAVNSGVFQWTPPADLPAGMDYALMITSEAGHVNYTPLFAVDSTVAPKPSVSASPSSSIAESTYESATMTMHSSMALNATSTMISEHATITPAAHANSTMTHTGYKNSTATGYTNSTKLSTTKKASKTSSSETGNATSTAKPTQTSSQSSAMSLLKSPLALVLCVFGAVVYLN